MLILFNGEAQRDKISGAILESLSARWFRNFFAPCSIEGCKNSRAPARYCVRCWDMEMRPTIRNVAVVGLEIRVPLLEFSADRFADAAAASARCRDKGGKGDVKRKYSRILITRFIRQAEYQARFCIPMNISSGINVSGIYHGLLVRATSIVRTNKKRDADQNVPYCSRPQR